MTVARWSRMFDGVPASVGQAREFVRLVLDGHDLTDETELVVSELSTNAIAHTGSGTAPGGRFAVELEACPGRVWAAVVDEGGAAEPVVSAGDPASPSLTNGRGLFLVQVMSAKWGSEPAGRGRRVWAEIASDP
jgi:anti-sigma regulatory factor (Ser/Thr protein kinase)